MDFLIIDGDHSYEGVRQDFEDYAPLVREGGLIAFHDIIPDYETRFGMKSDAYAGGVYRFWDEVKYHYRVWTIVEDPNQDSCGFGILRYSKRLKARSRRGGY